MAQARKNSASQPSEMTVLDKGNKIARPSSVGSPKQNTIKIVSEGLIVLPPEPGAVKFENVAMCTHSDVHLESSCGGRVGSAGRVERSLQMTRKKETDFDLPRSNVADGQIENSIQSKKEVQVKSPEALKPMLGPHASSSHTEKKEDLESSAGDSSDSDDDDDDDDDDDEGQSTLTNGAGAQGNKVEASVELKGEFLKAVMDEDYEKAKELCQKILLLEPDNKTCSEFHAVIVEKMKQEEEGSDDDGTDESDNSSEHDDDEDNEDEESDDESSDDDGNSDDGDNDEDDTDSDDDFKLPPGPINLIMGGLPIRPQSR